MSSSRPPLTFKFADEDWEFEQIHRLNYRTFVEEIPQHQASPSHRLVDKFHAENTYLICLSGSTLAGMLAVRAKRPFSLDQKVPSLDSYLPPGRKVCEIRLLAVDRKFRGAQVLQGILALLWQHGIEMGYDLAVISGTTRQFKLYHHLGFIPFGPLVGTGEAQFQPMYVTLQTFEKTAREFLRSSPSRSFQASTINFLPGPVTLRREVRAAFEQAPESHRSESFLAEMRATKQLLCSLVGAPRVELFTGSGTLANDVVGFQLAQLGGSGLVLANGEFGERLADQARRLGLNFRLLSYEWGKPLDLAAVRRELAAGPKAWMWTTHCETSTGVLNDLEALKALAAEFHVRLCLDCISSVGTLPLNLADVHLATCSSGKGLRSYPGVSMVFYREDPAEASLRLPRYLDLGFYARNDGVPFTFPSNLLHALHVALKRVDWPARFEEVRDTGAWLRERFVAGGFDLVGGGTACSPAVVTIALAADQNSNAIGEQLREAGYLVSFQSEYLRRKNWIQVCTMGENRREKLVSLLNALQRVCGMRTEPAPQSAAHPA